MDSDKKPAASQLVATVNPYHFIKKYRFNTLPPYEIDAAKAVSGG